MGRVGSVIGRIGGLASRDRARTIPAMLEWFKRLLFEKSDQGTLGQRGENVAARFLRNLGYTIIIRNFRCKTGEVDIIARDGKTIVFVEVKTRSDDNSAEPEQQVDPAKQQQLTKVAKFYLTRYGRPQPPARFDVIAIVWRTGSDPVVRHIPDAFGPTF